MTKLAVGPALVITGILLGPPALWASRSSSLPPPAQKQTPEQDAARYFNDGLEYTEKGDKLGKEAAAETDATKKDKLTKKSLDKYSDAVGKFTDATKKNPKLFQAWGSLGYAYRKTGKYTDALVAYNKALEIEPGYTPAIEYRAEAFLELDRLDDVKDAYMFLFRNDRPRANELDAAIETWIQKRKAQPGSSDPAAFESFSKWAAERRQLASQTSSLLQPSHAGW
ncbi:MAG TPA: tetratricopeptide repeat protein [Thermoanaerobaculia bacterium]|jgi:tetratricopeptide (TPR) repeat protein|nr:tetratricopeptide repeat protein [Thermoanaerobaculia bacterium]